MIWQYASNQSRHIVMTRFENRSIFVTGAGHGIGRAIAQRLSSEGGRIALADIDVDAASRAAKDLVESGGNAFAVRCDVTDGNSVDASIAESLERLGKLDVLVNTAGGDFDEPDFEEITDDLWNRKIDLNLTGTMRCIRAPCPISSNQDLAAMSS